MMSFNFVAIFLLLSVSSLANASTRQIAEVIKIRGTVTKLLPGALEATKVLVGDKFLEDTSVVTGEKSFVKIKFIDNSEVNMGPESKIVISEMKESTPGILSLLKGRIRAEVLKSSKGETKLFIRTRTAALGIRGTDFQTIYNPDNRMTSLLTFKGEVAMAKLDEGTHQLLEEDQKIVSRDDTTRDLEIKSAPKKIVDEREELKKVFAKSDVVTVAPGQNAFSSSALKKASLPIIISPVQLNALYKNEEFEEKAKANLKPSLATAAPTKSDLAIAPQNAPKEGFYDAKTGDFAPRAGGVIDLNTGLYIAPEKNSSIDAQTGLYKIEKSGDVDSETGQYIAPKGLILDAKKGFVVESEKEKAPELLALKDDLNQSIARDIVVGDLEGEVAINQIKLDEKFIRNTLTFSFLNGTEDIGINDEKPSSPQVRNNDKRAMEFGLKWQFASASRFTSFVGLSYRRVAYGSLLAQGDEQDSKSLFNMSLGGKYALTNRLNLISSLRLNQGHYLLQTGSTAPETFSYKRIVITNIALGAEYLIYTKNRFSLNSELHAVMSLRKRFNTAVILPDYGLEAKLMPQYALTTKQSIGLGAYYKSEENQINNTFGSNYQWRDNYGLEFNYNVSF